MALSGEHLETRTQIERLTVIRRVTAGELIDAAFELLPTFQRLHFTLLLPDLDRVEELLDLLGPERPNPRYGQRQRPPRR